jgi:drug/metabolite transporter (DMT)-like permease
VENLVFLAVLIGALSHASWNTLIKGAGLDPLSSTTLICIGSALVALVLLPFVGNPAWAVWPWLLASTVIHLVYFAALIEAYRAGDLGQVYPIARGAAPLMTATATTFVVGEKLSVVAWAGILVLVAGVFLLSVRGGRDLAKIDRKAVGFALLTALTICAYSVVDGIGARVSGNSFAYVLWLFVFSAVAVVPYALYRDGRDIMPAMQSYWRRGLAGGALQIVSYGIVLWAMTLAPIAVVATLRETSVLFGAVIAVAVLKEPLRATRIVAALLIVCGLVLIRLQ